MGMAKVSFLPANQQQMLPPSPGGPWRSLQWRPSQSARETEPAFTLSQGARAQAITIRSSWKLHCPRPGKKIPKCTDRYGCTIHKEKFCRLKPESMTHRNGLSQPCQHQRAPKYPIQMSRCLLQAFPEPLLGPAGEQRERCDFLPKTGSSENKTEVSSLA